MNKIKESVLNKRRVLIMEKIRESAISVLPILLIVTLLCLSIVPMRTDLLLSFLLGSVMIILGMAFFTLGAERFMTPTGTGIGTSLTKSKKLWLILPVSFLLGLAITVSEPDLQVLAQTVPHIDTLVLILTVGIGVGFFLAVCMFRILSGIKLRWLLLFFYAIVFGIACFSSPEYIAIAFDSGGVTTGPMTVPFILALGVGVANIRSDRDAEQDSFGLVALCSIGPILAVLLLGFFYKSNGASSDITFSTWENTAQLGRSYLAAIPTYLEEMALALAPIVVIALIFQFVSFRSSLKEFVKTYMGLVYTYAGLVLFLTGVNVGFSSMGTVLGSQLADGPTKYLLIPLSMVMGWFIISAEPAVYVLEKQIEEVSSGAITGKSIKISLAIAIALAMGLSMLRVITGISIMWILVPGYLTALVLTFFVPDIFTAIAFDSGGVASGPMTATFMLNFIMGASLTLGGNYLTDAFGLVATVAMMPLISVQILGAVYAFKQKKTEKQQIEYKDDEIIELWQ